MILSPRHEGSGVCGCFLCNFQMFVKLLSKNLCCLMLSEHMLVVLNTFQITPSGCFVLNLFILTNV